MHHHRAVVAQQPAALRAALATGNAGVGHMPQRVLERAELPPRGRRGDHEIVRQIGVRAHIEQDDRFRLPIIELFDDRPRQPLCILFGGTNRPPRRGVGFRRSSGHTNYGSAHV